MGAAAASYAAHAAAASSSSLHHGSMRHSRYMADEAIADLLSESRGVIHSSDDRQPIYLLFVQLRTLQLAPGYANSRFQMRLRYGSEWRYAERYSPKVRSTPKGPEQCVIQAGCLVQIQHLEGSPELNGVIGICECWDSERDRWNVRVSDAEVKSVRVQNIVPASDVFATLDDVQMFRWDPELPPCISFAIRKLGFCDSTIAEEAVRIPFSESRLGVAEQEMMMFKPAGKLSMQRLFTPDRWRKQNPVDGMFVGQIGVAIELKRFTLGELRIAAMGPSCFHELMNTLELLVMADALGAMSHPMGNGPQGNHGIPRSIPMASSMGMFPHLHDPHDNHERSNRPSSAGYTTGRTPGSPGIQTGIPVSGSMPGSAAGHFGSAGSTCVIGRPVPGAGWSWRGERMKPRERSPSPAPSRRRHDVEAAIYSSV